MADIVARHPLYPKPHGSDRLVQHGSAGLERVRVVTGLAMRGGVVVSIRVRWDIVSGAMLGGAESTGSVANFFSWPVVALIASKVYRQTDMLQPFVL